MSGWVSIYNKPRTTQVHHLHVYLSQFSVCKSNIFSFWNKTQFFQTCVSLAFLYLWWLVFLMTLSKDISLLYKSVFSLIPWYFYERYFYETPNCVGKGNWGRGLIYHWHFCLLLKQEFYSVFSFFKSQCECLTHHPKTNNHPNLDLYFLCICLLQDRNHPKRTVGESSAAANFKCVTILNLQNWGTFTSRAK